MWSLKKLHLKIAIIIIIMIIIYTIIIIISMMSKPSSDGRVSKF